MFVKWCDRTGQWSYGRIEWEYCAFWTLTHCYRIILGGFREAERLWGSFNPNDTQRTALLTEKYRLVHGIHKTHIPIRQSAVPGVLKGRQFILSHSDRVSNTKMSAHHWGTEAEKGLKRGQREREMGIKANMLTESQNSLDHMLRLMVQLCFSAQQTVVIKQLCIKGSDLQMSGINTEYVCLLFSKYVSLCGISVHSMKCLNYSCAAGSILSVLKCDACFRQMYFSVQSQSNQLAVATLM